MCAAVSTMRRVLQGAQTPRPLQGVRDQKIVTTAGAARPGKAMGQDAALRILAEILLNVSGNRESP